MKKIMMAVMLIFCLGVSSNISVQANNCWWSQDGRQHCSGLSWKTQKVLKGGLVGAGVGAGAALLMDKPIGRTALVGAGVGAGTQAVRYSQFFNQHPVGKTAAYGALAGTGASQVIGNGSLGKGAVVGGLLGTGFGVLRNHF